MLVPVLTATVAAYAVTVLLMKRSILTEKIARRGQHISREYAVDPYQLMRVSEVMVRQVDTLAADLPIEQAVATLVLGKHRIYPVTDAVGRPVGLVTRADALLWKIEGGHNAELLGERISDASLATIHPDDVVSHAVDVMLAADQGRVPVVHPKTGVMVGLVTRKDLFQVRAAVSRSESERAAFFTSRRTVDA